VLDVGAKDFPELFVTPFTDKVQVHFTHGGQVAVRIVHRDRFRPWIGDGQPVVGNVSLLQRLEDSHPYAVGLMLHRNFARRCDDSD
jgi:hypothetical protein